MTPRTPPTILDCRYLVIAGCRDGETTIVATGADSYAQAVGKMDMVRRVYPRSTLSIEDASTGRVYGDNPGRLL